MIIEKGSYLSTEEALKMARDAGISISLPTLIQICRTRKMGKQIGGPGTKWFVYSTKFKRFLQQGLE